MANLKDTKRKIKSVKNTQKTTRAMKLVSTVKLKRSKELSRQAKIYDLKLTQIINDIAASIQEIFVSGLNRDLIRVRKKIKTVDIIFVTSDKGLCGGFNHQTIKEVSVLIDKYTRENITVRLRGIGKKGVDFFNFRDVNILDAASGLSASPNYEKASQFIENFFNDFLTKKTDKVILVYNGYKNMIAQELQIKTILPIELLDTKIFNNKSTYKIEAQDPGMLFQYLVKKYNKYSLYYGLVSSLAAEHSARMQAMDSATKNSEEMIYSLTISYNKARQEAITTELSEIISGAESQK